MHRPTVSNFGTSSIINDLKQEADVDSLFIPTANELATFPRCRGSYLDPPDTARSILTDISGC